MIKARNTKNPRSADNEALDSNNETDRQHAPRSLAKTVIRFGVVLAVCGAAFIAYKNYGHLLSLEHLASKESELRQYQVDNPYLVYILALTIYVIVAGLALPGAAALTLVYGWYFGFARAMLVVSFGSTAGAMASFLLSRYLLRDSIQARFGNKLKSFNESLEREGAFYLFTLRLIPAVPFFVINLVMGLTPLKTGTFWWVSQLGMIPGTIVYVFAGSQLPNLATLAEKGTSGILTPKLIGAFVLLGVFPIAVKKIMQSWRRPASQK